MPRTHSTSGAGAEAATPAPRPPSPRRALPPHAAPSPQGSTRLAPVYSATEASEDAAEAVSQSLSVLLLGLRLSTGKASRDSTLLGRGTGQGWEGGRHTSSRLRLVPAGGTPPRNGPGCTTSIGKAVGRSSSGSMASLPQQNMAPGTEPSPGHQGAWAGRATLRWHRGVGGQHLPCWYESQVTRARTLLLPPDKGRTRGRRGLVGGVQAQWGHRPLCSPTASAMALGPPPLTGTHSCQEASVRKA